VCIGYTVSWGLIYGNRIIFFENAKMQNASCDVGWVMWGRFRDGGSVRGNQ